MFRNAAFRRQFKGRLKRSAAALLMAGLLQNSFAQSLRFESIQVSAPGRLSFRLETTPGKTYLLESSTTLNGWNPVASRPADRNVIEFVQPLDAPARFFRAVEITLDAVPGSDQFAAAGELKGAIATGRASNAGASSEAGEPDHSWFDAGKNSVWWKWTAPGSGRATLSVIGSHFETLIAVYSGPSAGSLQTVARNRRSSKLIGFDAKAGNTYHIAVAGHFSAAGDIRLALQLNSSTSAAAPKSVAGYGVFFDETSNPNIPLRVLEVSPDGLWWQDRDNGSSDAVDLGTVIGYEGTGAVGMLTLAAHRASETNTIRYSFTFDTESTGAYSYSIDGVPSESGRFANFRDTRNALAPPSLARTVLQTVRTRTSLGSSGQRHLYTFGWAGDFHDSDGQEHGSGAYSYSASGTGGTVRISYSDPVLLAGDSHEMRLKFLSSTHGTYSGEYRRNDGAVIEIEGDFVLEFVQ